jgi:uncharacterized protein YqgC (DUF456 family)
LVDFDLLLGRRGGDDRGGDSSSDVGLIVGLSVAIPVAIAIVVSVVVVAVVVERYRHRQMMIRHRRHSKLTVGFSSSNF